MLKRQIKKIKTVEKSLLFYLIASFLLLSIVPIIIVSNFAVNSTTQMIQEKTGELFSQLAEKNVDILNVKLSGIVETTESIKTDEKFVDLLSSTDEVDTLKKHELSRMVKTLKSSNSDILALTFIKPTNEVLNFGTDTFLENLLSKKEYSYDELYANTKGNFQDSYWLEVGDVGKTVYVARYLYDYVGGNNLGIVVVSVNIKVFDKTFSEADKNGEGILFVSKEGDIIYSKDVTQIGKRIPDIVNDNEDWSSYTLVNDNVIVVRELRNEWRLIMYVSKASLMNEIITFSEYMLIIGIFAGILAVIVSIVVSLSISKPIKTLNNTMDLVGNGNLKIRSSVKGNKEISELSRGFNTMLDNMEELIKKNDNSFAELEQAYEKTNKVAFSDYLTGLPNRRALINKIDMLVRNGNKPFVLLSVDVDDFKVINDSVGHTNGDLVLLEISSRLQQCIKTHAKTVATFGGDEFIVLLEDYDEILGVEYIAKQILSIFDMPFMVVTKQYFLSASIGASVYPEDGSDNNELLTAADAALNNAKISGKNKFFRYDSEMQSRLIIELQLIEELRNSIEANHFQLMYQPQINLHTNKICGFEALLRWIHPVRGMISPITFIPLAEKTGLIVKLTRWILKTACEQVKQWEDMELGSFEIGVNLSARQFRDKEIVSIVSAVLEETKIDASSLNLELTETIALDNIDYTIETMNEIKSFGVKFSIDDFGTGYSSMNYLKVLPTDFLKIDKSFIDNIAKNNAEKEIVKAIIMLSHALKLDVVSEGIEDVGQAEILTEFGCDIAQGYLYGRPLTKDSITEFIQNYDKKSR